VNIGVVLDIRAYWPCRWTPVYSTRKRRPSSRVVFTDSVNRRPWTRPVFTGRFDRRPWTEHPRWRTCWQKETLSCNTFCKHGPPVNVVTNMHGYCVPTLTYSVPQPRGKNNYIVMSAPPNWLALSEVATRLSVRPFVCLFVCLSHAPSPKLCVLEQWVLYNKTRYWKSNPAVRVAVWTLKVAETSLIPKMCMVDTATVTTKRE